MNWIDDIDSIDFMISIDGMNGMEILPRIYWDEIVMDNFIISIHCMFVMFALSITISSQYLLCPLLCFRLLLYIYLKFILFYSISSTEKRKSGVLFCQLLAHLYMIFQGSNYNKVGSNFVIQEFLNCVASIVGISETREGEFSILRCWKPRFGLNYKIRPHFVIIRPLKYHIQMCQHLAK